VLRRQLEGRNLQWKCHLGLFCFLVFKAVIDLTAQPFPLRLVDGSARRLSAARYFTGAYSPEASQVSQQNKRGHDESFHAACGKAASAARASQGFHQSPTPRSRAMMPALM
jgi:hypothetical protein